MLATNRFFLSKCIHGKTVFSLTSAIFICHLERESTTWRRLQVKGFACAFEEESVHSQVSNLSDPRRAGNIFSISLYATNGLTVIVGRGIPSPTPDSEPDMRLSHSSGSLPHEPLSSALYWDALTSTELDTCAFGVGRMSGLQSACASAIRLRLRLLRCPLVQQPHVSLS
jgi:hypothetical protein